MCISSFSPKETDEIEYKIEDDSLETTTMRQDVNSREGMGGNQYHLHFALNIFSISATPYVQLLSTKEQKKILVLRQLTTECKYQPGQIEGKDNDRVNARCQNNLCLSIATNGVKVNADADVFSSTLSTLSYNGLVVNSERTRMQKDRIKALNTFTFNVSMNVQSLEVDVWVHRIPNVIDSETLSDVLLLMSVEMKFFALRLGSEIINSKLTWDQPGENTMVELMLGYLCISLCDKIASGIETRGVESPENVSISTFPIISLGTDNFEDSSPLLDKDELGVRMILQTDWNEGLQLNSSLNIFNGTLTVALKEIDEIITFFLSGELSNTKSILDSFRNKLSILLTEIITKPDGGQKEMLSSLCRSEIEVIQVVLAFIRVENFNIVIPCYEGGTESFSLHWEEVDINSTFFHNIERLHSYSSKVGSTFFMRELIPGFHHFISFRQKLSYLGISNMTSRNQTIINSFAVKYCFNVSKWSCRIEDCSMSIMEMDVWKKLRKCILSCRTYFLRIITSILDASTNSQIVPATELDSNTPVGEAHLLVSESLICQRNLLERLKKEVSLYEKRLKDNFDTQQFELGKANIQLFEKELALAHVHSFVSNQACGFVHIARVNNEQRSTLTTNFLRYWARVDESHIILSKHPSEVRPQRYNCNLKYYYQVNFITPNHFNAGGTCGLHSFKWSFSKRVRRKCKKKRPRQGICID